MVAFYFVEILVKLGYYKAVVVVFRANKGGNTGLYRRYWGKLPMGCREQLLPIFYNKWIEVKV
ncbi:MAG TPA: hypothetical protein DCF91_13165 [Porphyromonadaceae bacterium]|nr:hypothetical protein [Porphyromonadaceae bacterium]